MEDQKNLFLFLTIAVAIYLGFLVFVQPYFVPPKPPAPAPTTQTSQGTPPAPTAAPSAVPGTPAAPTAAATAPTTKSRAAVIAEGSRVRIETPRLHGSISLVGARFDDLTLATYRETVDPKSPEIELLTPSGAEHAYFMQFGWVSADPKVKVPSPDSTWTSAGGGLTPDHPVELKWDNGEGLTFVERIAVDADYMFTVTQAVENHSSEKVALRTYGRVARIGQVEVSRTYLLHEGPIGVLEGTLHDGSCILFFTCDPYDYGVLKKNFAEHKPAVTFTTTGGWSGFTDKYWLTALIPAQDEAVSVKLQYQDVDQTDFYQADYTAKAEQVIEPNGKASETSRAFAGAKEVNLLDRYEASLNIPRFDRAIDFGWFYWITKPIFRTLDFFYGQIGNFGLSIMLLTLIIKLIFFPLANRSYRAMSKMKLLQPEIAKLREKFPDDKAKLNQEVMALYKRVGANPMAGCLPIFVQIPVFFSLYKVLYVTIEMRQAPFYGWIHDLSAPDPTTWLNLFGLLPWTAPTGLAFVSLGAWPLMMGVTMFLQQKLNPAPADPVQAKMMMALPLVFTFMLGQFPAGLVIYWSWNNLLSIAQQWVIMHRAGAA